MAPTEAQLAEDTELLRNILNMMGRDPSVFDGLDPSSWRIDPSEEEEEANQAAEDAAPVDYDSDDSTGGMILNMSHLKKKKRERSEEEEPVDIGYKPNKARAAAAEEEDQPINTKDAAVLEKEGLAWEVMGLKKGHLSAENEIFIPWKLVVQYPEVYVGKRNGARCAPFFTPEGLHKNRIWDLYYLHQPKELKGQKPALFVPTWQFQHLLDVVNTKLDTKLTIPLANNEDKFRLLFGIGNTPRPRYLGRSTDVDSFDKLRDNIPAPKPDDDLKHASHMGRELFVNMMTRLTKDYSKSKKSDKNKFKRTIAHRQWGRSIKITQRYLGLRRTNQQKLNDALDSKPEGSVLFVAIDLEAYELNQGIITEVGIATLDTNDLEGILPGENGVYWLPLVQARHIRMKENAWAENSKYVKGCADRFNFGTTEFAYLRDIPSIMENIIDKATLSPTAEHPEPRPVVLLFHESSADIKFLQTANYSVYNAKNVVGVMDTKDMYQYIRRSNNSASLVSVLEYLGFPYQNLHNAGNDATYTLKAMIGIAVKQRVMSLERAGKPTANESHVTFSEWQDKEGWTSGGEDSDGGDPVRPHEFELDHSARDNGGW